MLAGTLAFSAGIVVLLQLVSLPPIWILFIAVPVSIFSWFSRFFRYFTFFFIGFCWAWFQGNLYLKQVLPENLENMDVLISGVVTELPEKYTDHVRFRFKIHEIKEPEDVFWSGHPNLRLSWYKSKLVPKPGQVWQLRVRLKRPYGFMNTGGFDYEAWLMRKSIHALGYVRKDVKNQLLEKSPDYFLQKFRYIIAQKIKGVVPADLYGLVLALSLGTRNQLTPKQIDTLTRTGTNHLIAISGLHLGFIAGLFFLLSRFIWSRFYFLTQYLSAPVFASVSAFVAAFLYAAMAGFSLPTQRALIMIGVFLFTMFSGRKLIYSHVIALTVLVILLIDPFSIVAVDFWLSFSAVCFILYITGHRFTERNRFVKWIRIQCYLSLALCPLLILWFNQFPLYTILANFIAIPVIGFVVVPLMLLTMLFLFLPPVSSFLYHTVFIISDKTWFYLEFLAQQKYSVIPVSAHGLLSVLLAVVGVLVLLMPRGLPGRWLGVIWFFPLLFPIIDKPKFSEFELNLLDVGQGLSAVIQTENHVLVYDTGARFSERFNIGDAVVVPFLRKSGIDQISTLLISHGDNDHIGGAKAILNKFKVLRILTSDPGKIAYPETEKCHTQQHWDWDGVKFEILHPNLNEESGKNNNSCVLKISGDSGSVILTGDIEKEAEQELLKQNRKQLKADVLIVPHHGSNTSSALEFIDAISPKYAFFPVGYKNRFGFPKQDILSRYEDRGIETRLSYRAGTLSVRFQQNGFEIDAYRPDNRHFWHYVEHSAADSTK